ncbi:MAG: insulinase family protein [Deltaproteobacteria bacterium]|nr:insulinase family protein [Deltaproteobacteria bacterium]
MFLSLLMLLGTASAAAPVFPYAYQEVTLRNGLTLVMVPRPGTGLVAYNTLVRAGARNEVEPGRSGFAHFFEHMMFRGTPSVSAEQYAQVIRQHGASNNAYTDDDLTLFTTAGRAEGLPDFIRLEADRFQNLRYARDGFETEAAAVLGEYLKEKSSPGPALWEALRRTAFTRHSYRHPVIGFEDDIRAMPRAYEYGKSFFRNYYTPDNCVVIIVGDFDPAAARALVEREYGPWKGRAVLPRTEREPPQHEERRVLVQWAQPARPRALWAWHVPAATPATLAESATAGVVADLVFGPTSPLYQDLVLHRQWCNNLYALYQEHRDPNLLVLSLLLRDAARADDVEAAVEAELRRVTEEGVPEARLQAVKSHARYALLASLEKEEVIADTLANEIHLTGKLRSMEERFAARAAVSVEDVRSFVGRYLVTQNRTVATLQPPAAAAEEP